MRGRISFIGRGDINSVIARAKMRVLKCITAVFECDARTNAKTVMASNKCAMFIDVKCFSC